jgi:CRISPR system Cascade subunit CasE
MSIYLSRIRLDPKRRQTQRLLASRQRMHAALLATAVPEESERRTRADARVLWRIDADDPCVPTILLLTPHKPDLSRLAYDIGQVDNAFEYRDFEPFLKRLREGQHYRFRLTANPTHSVRLRESEPTRRVGHVTYVHQLNWLLSRQERLGFRIPENSIGEPEVIVARRGRESFMRDGHRVTLTIATYEGILEVVSDAQFRDTLTRGVGPGKAYGCGLMTLAPLRGG